MKSKLFLICIVLVLKVFSQDTIKLDSTYFIDTSDFEYREFSLKRWTSNKAPLGIKINPNVKWYFKSKGKSPAEIAENKIIFNWEFHRLEKGTYKIEGKNELVIFELDEFGDFISCYFNLYHGSSQKVFEFDRNGKLKQAISYNEENKYDGLEEWSKERYVLIYVRPENPESIIFSRIIDYSVEDRENNYVETKYYKNGKKSKETNRLAKKITSYFPNGQIYTEFTYKGMDDHNYIDSSDTEYNEKGEVVKRKTVSQDEITCEESFEIGVIKYKKCVDKYRFSTTESFYDENGVLISEQINHSEKLSPK